MGATPLFALALVGMPVTSCRSRRSARSSRAARRSARRPGIPIAGGHTIDSVEPIYGLVAIGLVDPRHLKRNAGARPGDALVLGKPLGVGIYSAALKKRAARRRGYAAMLASTTQLNTPGIALGRMDARPRADRRDRLRPARPSARDLPRLARRRDASTFARMPLLPGRARSSRARASSPARRAATGRATATKSAAPGVDAIAARRAHRSADIGRTARRLRPDAVESVLAVFRAEGFAQAAVIGEIVAGPARVDGELDCRDAVSLARRDARPRIGQTSHPPDCPR